MAAQQEIANLCLQLMASQEQLQQTRQQDQMQAQALMQFHPHKSPHMIPSRIC